MTNYFKVMSHEFDDSVAVDLCKYR